MNRRALDSFANQFEKVALGRYAKWITPLMLLGGAGLIGHQFLKTVNQPHSAPAGPRMNPPAGPSGPSPADLEIVRRNQMMRDRVNWGE